MPNVHPDNKPTERYEVECTSKYAGLPYTCCRSTASTHARPTLPWLCASLTAPLSALVLVFRYDDSTVLLSDQKAGKNARQFLFAYDHVFEKDTSQAPPA
eukprot:gene6634-6367_t